MRSSKSVVPGASIYRRGGKQGSGKWQVAFTDEHDVHKAKAISRDYATAVEWAKKEVQRIERSRLGLPPVFELKHPTPLYNSPDPTTPKPESGLLLDFMLIVKSRGRSTKHRDDTKKRIVRLLRMAQLKWPGEISESRIQIALGKLMEQDQLSAQTLNHYRRAMKSFTRWMAKPSVGHLQADPLSEIPKYDEKADRRHARRGMTDDEIARLLDAAGCGPIIFGISGREREALWLGFATTGLRCGAMRTLRVGAFVLDGPTPHVHITPRRRTKERKERLIPLNAEDARWFKNYFAMRHPEDRAFRMPHPCNVVKMLRRDLEVAGMQYCNTQVEEDGVKRRLDVLDAHSLRHGYGTRHAIAGTSPKIAQTLMGHSSIAMTMDIYSHVPDYAAVAAVASLPPLRRPAAQPLRTG